MLLGLFFLDYFFFFFFFFFFSLSLSLSLSLSRSQILTLFAIHTKPDYLIIINAYTY